MMRDRIVLTLFLSAVLVCSIGFFRTDSMTTASQGQWFWTWKTHSERRCDVVVLGDSRAYRGVSPESMGEVLPGYRIINFGYSSGSLSPLMLAEAEKRLDSRGKRIIVLGVTPHAMTPKASKDEHYLQEKNRATSEIVENLYIAPLKKYFEPATPIRLVKETGRKKKEYREEFHENGWVATRKEPPDPAEAIVSYAKAFTENRVSTDLLDNVIVQTGTWVREGIRVYAFRPPTTPEMIELESQLSGFDEKAFLDRFGKAGGIWIPVSLHEYRSYDGSHIDEESAKRLSVHIAESIWKHEGHWRKEANTP
jgi:hypothetical protein